MKIIIYVYCFLFILVDVNAQEAIFVINSPKSTPQKRTVQIKLITRNMNFDEGVFIYRKEIGLDKWQKINDIPIRKAELNKKGISEDTNEVYEMYRSLVSETPKEENDKNFVNFMVTIQALSNNEFARLLGIYSEDLSVSDNKSYVYKFTKLVSGKEIEVATSEQLTIRNYEKNKNPSSPICKREQKSVAVNWAKSDLFFAWNLYRKSSRDKEYVKVNTAPIMILERQNKEGANFVDTNISENKTYYYKLVGLDIFGNESEFSREEEISIKDQTAPESIKKVLNVVNVYEVKLSWEYANPPLDMKGFNIYRSKELEGVKSKVNSVILNPDIRAYTDKVDVMGKVYYYYVEAVDVNGNSSMSNVSAASVTDVIPPSKPKINKAEGGVGVINLTFRKQIENDFFGYNIYKAITPNDEFILLNSRPYQFSEFIDSIHKTVQVPFYYKIRAIDSSYNESDYSDIISAKLNDVTPPFKPFLKGINVTSNMVTIKWLKNLDPDLLGYNLIRAKETDTTNWVQLNTDVISPDIVEYNDKSPEARTKYLYALVAIDSSKNVSEKSNIYFAIINKNNNK